jgi:hypothetical protein
VAAADSSPSSGPPPSRSESGPLPRVEPPPAPRAIPHLWAALLAAGSLGLALALPLGWLLPDGAIYPLGATLRVVSGLLAVLALSQFARPGRTSAKARRAILVSAFLLAAALAILLVGSGPAAPTPADGQPGAPEGIGLVVPFVLAALLGASWGGTRGLRSQARRGAWSYACRDWERAAWGTPLALGASSLATGTLCVLSLALEEPFDPSSYPIFTLGASLLHGGAAALVAQALASSLRDQAQLRGEGVPLLARLAPKGRAGLLALAVVIAPTVFLEGARLIHHLATPRYELQVRVTDPWQVPAPPSAGEPFRGPILSEGVIARPASGEALSPDESTDRLLWRLSLTRAGGRLASVEQELAATQSLRSQETRGLQIHTRRALGAPGYHLSVETWLEDAPGAKELRFTTWVALSSGAGDPRLGGTLVRGEWPESSGIPLQGSPRRLRLFGYQALYPQHALAPRAEAGLRWVLRWDGRLRLQRQLGAPPPAPGRVTLLFAAGDHSYHLVSEQELSTQDGSGARASSERETRVRRIPWRGGAW